MSEPTPGDRVAELEAENRELQAELERLRGERERAAQVVKGAGGLGTRLLLGRRLRQSFRAWLEAKSLRDPLPADETADVLAAIVRRVVRVGIIGLLVAALPGLLLVWQSFLMREQNTAIREQNAAIGTQIAQQASDTLIVRRAQLLATIYEEECEGVEAAEMAETGERPVCRPKAHPRARQEAVLAFSEIERGRGERPDLRSANLATLNLPEADLHVADLRGAVLVGADLSRAVLHADLRKADLSKADLSEADLRGANLIEAKLIGAKLFKVDLRGVFLFGADLRGAILWGAELIEADFRGADLRGAILHAADLRGAVLVGTDLRGADLSKAFSLSQEQVASAKGNAKTRLPEGLKRPESWE